MVDLPMTARGLLELRIAEHKGEVEVKKQDLVSSARGAVYRSGLFQATEEEVTLHVDSI